MQTFNDFHLNNDTLAFIEKNNFTAPMPIQAKVIPAVLKGKDVIGLSKTGSGKSHAYLIPVMEKVDPQLPHVQAVITSPTRELAMQIYDKAKLIKEVNPAFDIRLYVGGKDREKDLEALKTSQPHIVIGTPGRIKDLFEEADGLRLDKGNLLIVDEADMTLEYGFLNEIDAFAGKMGEDLQMLSFSATMPDQLKPFIKKYMHHPITIQIGERIRVNQDIRHVLVPCYHHSYEETILSILPGFQPYVCLIFANTRQIAATLSEALRKAGLKVNELHGDLTSRQRKQALKDLELSNSTYVVCTDLAARGIDIDTVTHVISCGFPEDLEYYIHRSGRTARGGNTGTCYALYKEEDDASIRSLMKSGIRFEHQRFKKNAWQDLRSYGEKYKKRDSEIEKKVAMIVTGKKKKVKPGYKKKMAKQIEKEQRHKRREFIRAKIKEEKKAMYKERQIKINRGEL